jgi:phosphate-selective porin
VWTAGVNWYPVRFVRVQANAIRERFADPVRTPVEGRDTFWSWVVRLQFAL